MRENNEAGTGIVKRHTGDKIDPNTDPSHTEPSIYEWQCSDW